MIEPKEISPYELVIKVLTKNFSIEEIFLFNQQKVYSADQKTTVRYLLIISNKIRNQDHFEMIQVVSQQTEARFNIIPIAHQKAWIKERLFVHQDFFKKVMVPESSIFRADVPTILHWITIDANGDTDEGIYYRLCIFWNRSNSPQLYKLDSVILVNLSTSSCGIRSAILLMIWVFPLPLEPCTNA